MRANVPSNGLTQLLSLQKSDPRFPMVLDQRNVVGLQEQFGWRCKGAGYIPACLFDRHLMQAHLEGI